MRALLPEQIDEVDLHAFYAANWLDRGGLRVNFIASADGAAHADGKSAGLQTPGDNAVFAALRDLADVVLVGAGTAVVEGYRAIRLSKGRAAIRADYGLPPELPTAVTSRTLRIDPASGLFAPDRSGARTIVLTCAAAPAERRMALSEVADVVICGNDVVEPAEVRAALTERGHTRVLSEGGPTAFAELAGAGIVDELCLSVSPLLSGPGPNRITAGEPWPAAHPVTIEGLLEEDGALFVRYRVGAPR